MSTLADAISRVAQILGSVPGIRQAPEAPPEQMNVFPFAVVYPADGEHTFGTPGERLAMEAISIEIHVARKDLPRDVATSLPFADSIPDALMADMVGTQWNSTIDTFDRINWTFGTLGWGGMETIGFKFLISGVKRRIVY